MTKEKERLVRMKKISKTLDALFPHVQISLAYKTHWQLLVAVMLSAQCTDKKVNEVTRVLFKKYPTFKNYLSVSQKQFEKDIRPTGFYKNKAKHILASAKRIHTVYNNRVPRSMKELLTLPGVARKTANVVLSNAFGIHEGIAVDTHVRRFAIKFNLTDYTDPPRIERDLMELVPSNKWNYITYQFITYGREICPARKHDCTHHPLTIIYPPAAKRFPRSS